MAKGKEDLYRQGCEERKGSFFVLLCALRTLGGRKFLILVCQFLLQNAFFYREGREERKGIAKENQREILAKLCDLRDLRGGRIVS